MLSINHIKTANEAMHYISLLSLWRKYDDHDHDDDDSTPIS